MRDVGWCGTFPVDVGVLGLGDVVGSPGCGFDVVVVDVYYFSGLDCLTSFADLFL